MADLLMEPLMVVLFSLTGFGDVLCRLNPDADPGIFTIEGDCGEGVTVNYRDDVGAGTLTGDVECILT